MAFVETKNRYDDDDDGLPMDLNLSDEDDDGLPMDLNFSDEDDDGLPMDLDLSDEEEETKGGDDMPSFESDFSKSKAPKPKKKKNHKCLKLPLIALMLVGAAEDSIKTKKQTAKLFNKAGRSRDTVIKAEIALKDALKISREKRDVWSKATVLKDIKAELVVAEAGEKILKELMLVGERLKILKVKLKENNKKTQENNRGGGKGSAGKSKKALAEEQKNIFSRLEKFKSRQKVLRSECVEYSGSLAEMEKRLNAMSKMPKELYHELAQQRKRKKELKVELTRPGNKTKKQVQQEIKQIETLEFTLLEKLEPKVAALKTHLTRSENATKMRNKLEADRKIINEFKIEIDRDHKHNMTGQKINAPAPGAPPPATTDGGKKLKTIEETTQMIMKYNKKLLQFEQLDKAIVALELPIKGIEKEALDTQKISKRAEKRLEVSKVMEERDVKECSTFARTLGRSLLLQAHPDKLNRDPTVQERTKFESLQTAHVTLGSASKLRQYLNEGSIHKSKLPSKTSASSSSTANKKKNKKVARNKDVGAADSDDDDNDEVMQIQGMTPGKCKKVFLTETKLISTKKGPNKGELRFWWRAGSGASSGSGYFELQLRKDGEEYQTVYFGTSDTWTSPPIDLTAYDVRVRETNSFGPGMWSVDLHVRSLEIVRHKANEMVEKAKRTAVINSAQVTASIEKLQSIQSQLNWTLSNHEDGIRYGCSMLRSAVHKVDSTLLKLKKSMSSISLEDQSEFTTLYKEGTQLQTTAHVQLDALQHRANAINREKSDANSMFENALVGVGGDAVQLEQCQHWLSTLQMETLQSSTRNYIFQKLESAAKKFSAPKGSCSASFLKNQEIFSADAVKVRTFGNRLIELLKFSVKKFNEAHVTATKEGRAQEVSVRKQVKVLNLQLDLMVKHQEDWKRIEAEHVRTITQMKKAKEEYQQQLSVKLSNEAERSRRFEKFLEAERQRAASMSDTERMAVEKLLRQPQNAGKGIVKPNSKSKSKHQKVKKPSTADLLAQKKEQNKREQQRKQWDARQQVLKAKQEQSTVKKKPKAAQPQKSKSDFNDGFIVKLSTCKIKTRIMMVNKVTLSDPFRPSDYATVQRVLVGKKNIHQQQLLKHSKCNIIVTQQKTYKQKIPVYLHKFVKPTDNVFCFLLGTTRTDITKGTKIIYGRLLAEQQRRQMEATKQQAARLPTSAPLVTSQKSAVEARQKLRLAKMQKEKELQLLRQQQQQRQMQNQKKPPMQPSQEWNPPPAAASRSSHSSSTTTSSTLSWFEHFLLSTGTEKYRQIFMNEECTDYDTLILFTDRDFDQLGIKKGARIRVFDFLKSPNAKKIPPQRASPSPQTPLQQQWQAGNTNQTNLYAGAANWQPANNQSSVSLPYQPLPYPHNPVPAPVPSYGQQQLHQHNGMGSSVFTPLNTNNQYQSNQYQGNQYQSNQQYPSNQSNQYPSNNNQQYNNQYW